MSNLLYKTLILYILFSVMCCVQGMAQKQHGKASYYSKRTTGAKTASGKRLHHDSLFCAHKVYPFGTHLKVTNLSNNKTVIVKVVDRGPFGRGRIIDLSWAAAKEIGMIAQGVASVKVELVENPIPYRPEEEKLPLVDFEVVETDFKPSTPWNKPIEQKVEKKTDHHTEKKKAESHTVDKKAEHKK